MNTWIRGWASVCLLLAAPAALAQAPTAEAGAAAELKDAGDQAMRRLAYGAALERYREAYAIAPDPALLYNMGRALQALGRHPEALEQMEAFARDAPPELKARVPKLDELLSELRAKVSTLELVSNVAGARVLVRRRQIGTTPLASVRLNAGTASVEVLADGYHPYKKTVKLPGGSKLRLDVTLHSKTTTGVLEVSSPVTGASVFVDGKRVGTAPVQTMLGAGEHRVLVRREGYDEAETSAVVSVGRTTRLDVPLDAPPPITGRWWFWTGVGVVVVAGAAITVALLTERDPDEGNIPPGQVSGPLLSF